jgi:molybdopterin converting factor subunit 1
MTITIRLFAALRERAGVSELTIDLPGGATVSAARERVCQQFPDLAGLLPRVAYAVNRNYVSIEAELHDGDELALIPPVSGG